MVHFSFGNRWPYPTGCPLGANTALPFAISQPAPVLMLWKDGPIQGLGAAETKGNKRKARRRQCVLLNALTLAVVLLQIGVFVCTRYVLWPHTLRGRKVPQFVALKASRMKGKELCEKASQLEGMCTSALGSAHSMSRAIKFARGIM